MGTRVRVNGRVVFERGIPRPKRQRVEYEEDGTLRDFSPLPPATEEERAVEAALNRGRPWTDEESGITFRVVDPAVLTPEGGWATHDFWVDHMCTTPSIFRTLVLRGVFDAAMPRGSAQQRFRCRNWPLARSSARKMEREAEAAAKARARGFIRKLSWSP